jgi:hypothetical protein
MWICPLEAHRAHPFSSRPLIETVGSHTERKLWHLYNEFGASLRTLVFYTSRPDIYESNLEDEIKRIIPTDLGRIFHNPRPNDDSHYVFAINPSPTDRTCFETTVASRRVFELFWKIHIRFQVPDMMYLYDLFAAREIHAPAAG